MGNHIWHIGVCCRGILIYAFGGVVVSTVSLIHPGCTWQGSHWRIIFIRLACGRVCRGGKDFIFVCLIGMGRPSLKVGDAIPGFRALDYRRVGEATWALGMFAVFTFLCSQVTMYVASWVPEVLNFLHWWTNLELWARQRLSSPKLFFGSLGFCLFWFCLFVVVVVGGGLFHSKKNETRNIGPSLFCDFILVNKLCVIFLVEVLYPFSDFSIWK